MRIRIKFNTATIFSAKIKVRISDINYGGHVGNDSILSIMHEARLAFLKQWNYTELNAAGCGLIMADSAIQYRAESFHGDEISVDISIDNITSISFDIFYKLSTKRDNDNIDIAYAKTGMICFDYASRKIMSVPEELKQKITYE